MSEGYLDYQGLSYFSDRLQSKILSIAAFTVTINETDWVNYTASISSEYAESSNKYAYIVASIPTTQELYNSYGIKMLDVTEDGIFTFTCRETPSGNLHVNVLKSEVVNE